MLKTSWLAVLVMFCQIAFAAENKPCVPITVKTDNKNIILPGPVEARTVVMYFFNNKIQSSLWLDHPVTRPSMSAGWSSYIRPGNWSALVVNRKNFTISCAVIKPGKVDYLDCSQVLSICSPQGWGPTKGKSTHWMLENKTWDEIVKFFTKWKEQ